MNPKVREASGHVGGFSDPLVDCKKCKSRERADQLIESWIEKNFKRKDEYFNAKDENARKIIVKDYFGAD
jgi:glycyl-tRNA synthetase (class II)